MNVIVHTRTKQPGLDKKLGFRYADSIDDLLTNSDIVSLHTPATADTKGMINSAFLAKMKKNSLLINTVRGSVVVDDDLFGHLEAEPGFWYATDVYNGEPTGKEGPFENKIAMHPRVFGHHHVGASTKQAEGAIGDEAVRIIRKFTTSGQVDNGNCVNKAQIDEKLHSISIRHLDNVGVLAHVFACFAKAEWNV